MGATVKKRRAASPAKPAPAAKRSRLTTKAGRKRGQSQSRGSKSTSRASRSRSRSKSRLRSKIYYSRRRSRSKSKSRSHSSRPRSRSRSKNRVVKPKRKATQVKRKPSVDVQIRKELNNGGRRVTRLLSNAAEARGISVTFDAMVDRRYARRKTGPFVHRYRKTGVPALLPLQLVKEPAVRRYRKTGVLALPLQLVKEEEEEDNIRPDQIEKNTIT